MVGHSYFSRVSRLRSFSVGTNVGLLLRFGTSIGPSFCIGINLNYLP